MRQLHAGHRAQIRAADAVAIVGISCRFPGAPDAASFWKLLAAGRHAIAEPPPERGPGFRPGGYLPAVDAFDAGFFGISPREAALMDPQQRLILELGWEATEDAGIAARALAGSRTAVFIGAMSCDYATLATELGAQAVTAHALTGLNRGIMANRLSHFLKLSGPSLTVDTGQSSSLVAVQLAFESLRRGECELAIAGGANLNLAAGTTAGTEKFGALSPDHRCFTFDARANGYVRGEGAGVVVLKPADRAIADGDRIYAVLLGGATNSGSAASLSDPSAAAQQDVLRATYAAAGVDPAEVGYVELHGTATRAGDPIEAAALGTVSGPGRPVGQPLLVGSVKTNIGHLEGAAGIAGLIKVALSLTHGQIPASLNFETPNPDIPFRELGLRVPSETVGWPGAPASRLAGVSSFGMGGTNCHLVLSAVPASWTGDGTVDPNPAEAGPERPRPVPVPWIISGGTTPAVRSQAERLADHVSLDEPDDPAAPGIAAVGRALVTSRSLLGHRAAVVAENRADLVAALRKIAAAEPPSPRGASVVQGGPVDGKAAFLFPGQGAQRVGMGRELHAAYPAYAAAFDAVCAVVDDQLGCSLRQVLWSGQPDVLNQTRFTQVSLFATEVASFRLLESFGLRPDLVVGHSVGEIAAAHVAGILSLEDAATFAVARGQSMQELPPGGAMASIQATEDEIRPLLDSQRVALAAINGPASVVVSGDRAAVDEIMAHFQDRSRQVRRLAVSHAFHSPLMDPALSGLRAVAAGLSFGRPDDIALVSSLTGRPAAGLDARSPRYWAEHARQPVRFADSLASLYHLGARLFVEVGRGRTLTGLARQALPQRGTAFIAGADTEREFVTRLAELQVHGISPDWQPIFGPRRQWVDLPGYPFQRSRHWLDTLPTAAAPAPAPTGLPVVPAGLPVVPAGEHAAVVDRLLATATAAVLGHERAGSVEFDLSFNAQGFDSRMAVELRGQLAAATGLDLPATVLFTYPTPRQLADHLCRELSDDVAAAVAGIAGVRDQASADAGEQIAIVAMGCRYPGEVRSPTELFDLAAGGHDAISDFPVDRGWDLAGLLGSGTGRSATAQGGFLHDAGEFDPQFFGISPREALAMDPQQRILPEIIWEAFERYGLDLGALRGELVGTYIGATHQDYGPRLHEGGNGVGGYLLTGSSTSVASGRIAYIYGFEGPAVTVDTACSSSLVALHLAVQALRTGECTTAIAGGVAVMSSPGMFVDFSDQHGLAPDGRCKPFSADADGTAWAEGAGVLVLERLSDARRRGHTVLALVVGSATNQDGASNGLTAPSGLAQEKVIRRALAVAGLPARHVDAVEAHGTGTALGDPIEAGALLAVYGRDRDPAAPLLVGSLKSNIGHTQAAAGVGGVIKMVEAMRTGTLPGTLHVREPTAMVDWTSGIALLTQTVPWPSADRPRRAAVSSFGISGTNAHVILEHSPVEAAASTLDAPAPAPAPGEADAVWPWVMSAREPATLRQQARQLMKFLEVRPSIGVADVAFTLAGRKSFEHRAVLIGRDRAGLLDQLSALAAGLPAEGLVEGRQVRAKTAFVFPGQGSQWPGMAGELLRTSPVFRAQLEACEGELSRLVDWSLLALLSGSADAPSMSRVDVVQPALFSVMVSLAALWRSLGVEPDAVIGHSQGEIAAAFVAGAITLEDGIRIVLRRSQLLRSLAGTGGMAAVLLGVDETESRLRKWAGRLDIAAVNGPASVTIGGDQHALEQFTAEARAAGVDVRKVDVDYASHTAAIPPLREKLIELLGGLRPRTGNVPLYSTLTAELLDTATMDAGYWYANLRNRVRFKDATRQLIKSGHRIFVEVSPHPVLVQAIHRTAQDLSSEVTATGSLRRDQGDLGQFLQSAASVYGVGRAVAWRSLLPGGRHTELPTYPFNQQRYWLNVSAAGPRPAAAGTDPAGTAPAVGPPEPAGLDTLAPVEQHRILLDLIRRHAAVVLGYPDAGLLAADQEFRELGFDSLTGLELRNRLNNAIGVELPAALIAEHPTPADVISYLQQQMHAGAKAARPTCRNPLRKGR